MESFHLVVVMGDRTYKVRVLAAMLRFRIYNSYVQFAYVMIQLFMVQDRNAILLPHECLPD